MLYQGERAGKEPSWVLPYKAASRDEKPLGKEARIVEPDAQGLKKSSKGTISIEMSPPQKGRTGANLGRAQKGAPSSRPQCRTELITRPHHMEICSVLAHDQTFPPLVQVKTALLCGRRRRS